MILFTLPGKAPTVVPDALFDRFVARTRGALVVYDAERLLLDRVALVVAVTSSETFGGVRCAVEVRSQGGAVYKPWDSDYRDPVAGVDPGLNWSVAAWLQPYGGSPVPTVRFTWPDQGLLPAVTVAALTTVVAAVMIEADATLAGTMVDGWQYGTPFTHFEFSRTATPYLSWGDGRPKLSDLLPGCFEEVAP